MKKRTDGGTAFPMQDMQAIHAYAAAAVEGVTGTDERDQVYIAARAEAIGGMSLRDYFAAHAPAAPASFVARYNGFNNPMSPVDAEVSWRWRYADQMLLARGGK